MMEFVNGKDDIPYMKWEINKMFQIIELNASMFQFAMFFYQPNRPNPDFVKAHRFEDEGRL